MAQTDFTIADVLAWARTKPAHRSYSFGDPNRCIMAQFGSETDRSELVGIGDLRFAVGERITFAASLGDSFGGFVRLLERQVEPNPMKRCWNRIIGFDPAAHIRITVRKERPWVTETSASKWTLSGTYTTDSAGTAYLLTSVPA